MNRRFLAFTLLLLSGTPAIAQDAPIVALDMTTMIGYAGTAAANYHAKEAILGKGHGWDDVPSGKSAPASSLGGMAFAKPAAAPAPAALASLTYAPSAAAHKRIMQQFIDRVGEQNAQAGENMKQTLEQNDLIGFGRNWLARYGLSATNVADTMAAYLTVAWLAAQGERRDPTRTELTAVRNQLAAAMLATPDYKTAADATKQEIAELSIVQAALVGQYVENAKNDPAQQPTIRKTVANGMRLNYKIDPATISLTDRGFIMR